MKIGELFAGYGGLGMGVQAALGGEIAWFSEFDKGPSKILAHRFPGIPNHGDITKIDWSQVEPVDILTGGSPCQDLSHAGRRAGMTEGTRSNLWVAMREAIAQLRPGLVVWENVRGAYSAAANSEVEPCPGCVGDGPGVHLRALGRVLGDLSDLGYDTRWHGLRAADVGAPHSRGRVFVVAARDSRGVEQAWVEARRGAPQGEPARLDSRADWRPSWRAAFEPYAPALDGWAALLGRVAPEPSEPWVNGHFGLSPAFVEWMMGLPAGWVTDVPGITRSEALKALGNGVCPQQCAAALREMFAWEVAA